MKKLQIFACLFVFLNCFAVIIETDNMKSVFSLVDEKIEEYGAGNVLVVFDIDNTLLTAKQDFGSFSWNRWQKDQILNNGPHAVTRTMSEFYKLETKLFALAKMKVTDDVLPSQTNSLRRRGVDVIALTSRGPQMRSVTEREIKDNKVSLSQSRFHIGFPGDYLSSSDKNRLVSFQKGIYMTSGQHKGLMLKELLERCKRSFKAIVFVDDLPKHTQHVSEVFSQLGIDITSLRYSKMDSHLEEFMLKDKSKVIAQWELLRNIWSSIFVK